MIIMVTPEKTLHDLLNTTLAELEEIVADLESDNNDSADNLDILDDVIKSLTEFESDLKN